MEACGIEKNEKNEKIKSIIAEILGIKVSNQWKIENSIPEKDLYNVHYEKNANMNEWGHLRGVIVDIANRRVVCSGYEYTPIIRNKDELKFDEKGQIELYDNLGKKYIVEKGKSRIVPAFEVVTVRAFLHKGEIYYPTYRQINIVGTKARWGDSIPFIEMGIECKLPDRDTLFPDKTKTSSNYVHIFMIIHKGVANVSKLNVDKGYILYGGVKKMWDPSPNDTDVDTNPVKLVTTTDMNLAKEANILFTPPEYTIEQANRFLKYGYYDAKDYKETDPRKLNGESVIIYLDGNSFKNVIRVQSTSYSSKSQIKDDHPNPKFRLYQLSNFAFNRDFDTDNLREFLKSFPLYAKFDVKTIVEKTAKGPIHFWPEGKLPEVSNALDRFYIVWVSLLMSVSPHMQHTVAKLYDEFMSDRNDIVDVLHKLYIMKSEGKSFDELPINLYNRTTKIIGLANEHASRISSKESLDQQVKYNLNYLINGEEGSSLYKIYKDCRALKELTLPSSTSFTIV